MRLWTLAEAQAALPEVHDLLATARRVQADLDEARNQLRDLQQMGGPAHERLQWKASFDAAHARLHEAVAAFEAAGISLKDITTGLIDFAAQMGDEVVWLCWRDGEDRIGFWHRMDTGFAGRRPIPEAPAP